MILTDIIQAGNSSHDEIDKLMVQLLERIINVKIRDTQIFVDHPAIVNVTRLGMLEKIQGHKDLTSFDVCR